MKQLEKFIMGVVLCSFLAGNLRGEQDRSANELPPRLKGGRFSGTLGESIEFLRYQFGVSVSYAIQRSKDLQLPMEFSIRPEDTLTDVIKTMDMASTNFSAYVFSDMVVIISRRFTESRQFPLNIVVPDIDLHDATAHDFLDAVCEKTGLAKTDLALRNGPISGPPDWAKRYAMLSQKSVSFHARDLAVWQLLTLFCNALGESFWISYGTDERCVVDFYPQKPKPARKPAGLRQEQ